MYQIVLTGTLLLLIDQASKSVLSARLAGRAMELSNVVTIRCVSVRRRHYSSAPLRLLLTALWAAAAASTLVLQQSGVAFQSTAGAWGIGAALGGAAGNLWDILRARAVTDFIDFRFWPAFNAADVAIVGGLAAATLWR